MLDWAYGVHMTVFEWSSSILGMLGFGLGVVNLIWMMRKHSPRLDIDVPEARMFKARIEKRDDSFSPNENREVAVLDLFVAISNISQTGNTIVSVQHTQPYKTKPFEDGDVLVIGKKVQDISKVYGDEKPFRSNIYFDPRDTIRNKVPAYLTPGSRIEGSLVGEIQGKVDTLEEAFDLVVVVKDSHGRTYKKSVRVNPEEPIDKTQYPLGVGVAPTIEVCSI